MRLYTGHFYGNPAYTRYYADVEREFTPAEIWAAINQLAQAQLHMSGTEFVRAYQADALPDGLVVAELGFLLGCLDDADIPT